MPLVFESCHVKMGADVTEEPLDSWRRDFSKFLGYVTQAKLTLQRSKQILN